MNVISLISDLYTAGTEGEKDGKHETKPFVQLIMLDGPRGEVVRLPASVDDRALVGIMCATKYNEVAHRLGALRQSFKKPCMANGALVPSRGSWEGMRTFGPAKAKVAFEVFC